MGKPSFARLQLEESGPDLDPWAAAAEAVRERVHAAGEESEEDKRLRSTTFRDWALQVPESRGPLDLERFAYQRELYDEHAAFDREQVEMKANQVGACLDPSTKVLTAALRWVELGELRPGDELVAVDENSRAPKSQGAKRRCRCMRSAVVEHAWRSQRDAVRLVFEDGATLIATAEHRLLWKRGKGDPGWRAVGTYRIGDSVRRLASTWVEERSFEDGWLAGIIDGEGFFRNRTQGGSELVIAQAEGPVLERAAAHLDWLGIHYWRGYEPRKNCLLGKLVVNRYADLLRLLAVTRPTRFTRNRWWDGRRLPGDGSSWSPIAGIESLGEREVVDLQTSTGTYIAEGLVSHNSTKSVRLAMFHADRGATVIYTLPTSTMLGKFSQRRVAPIIRGSDYLRRRIPSAAINNVAQKQVGWGWIEFRGTEVAIEEVDADMLIVDEYDFSDQANIEQSERRVSGPMSAGLIRRLGIPTVPNYGIARLYETTDQRAWSVKCEGCSEWNRLYGQEAWRANVDKQAAALVCRRCRKRIDVRFGEWVAAYPDRDVRGYHVPKLIVPGANLAGLIANSKKPGSFERQAFFNRDLGVAFAPEEGMLSLEALFACQRPELMLYEGLPAAGKVRVMSIDVASVRALNVIVREGLDLYTSRVVYAGLVEDEPGGRTAFETCCFLMSAFHVNMAAIDNEPNGRFAKAFCQRHPGRAYRVAYFDPKPGQRKDPPVWNVDDADQFVSVNRTRTIDATLDQFRLQRNLIPSLDVMPEDYRDHMRALVAQLEKTPAGNMRRFYISTGPDDWAHTEVYNLVAVELFWRQSGLESVRGEGPVPIAENVDYAKSNLADYGVDPEYHPGPEDAFGGGDFG